MYLVRFLLLLSLIVTMQANALQQDSKEKIYIVANSTLYNYKTGNTTYEGNVKVDQGTTHITADRLTTKTNQEHKINEMIAYGIKGMAHYWTLPNPNNPETHANAKIIKFYPGSSTVFLQQNATVIQGENSFQGQLILYNRADQTVYVPASNTGRAVVVYNPDKK
jgi:lipopolysaccharide export system protein LptA